MAFLFKSKKQPQTAATTSPPPVKEPPAYQATAAGPTTPTPAVVSAGASPSSNAPSKEKDREGAPPVTPQPPGAWNASATSLTNGPVQGPTNGPPPGSDSRGVKDRPEQEVQVSETQKDSSVVR